MSKIGWLSCTSVLVLSLGMAPAFTTAHAESNSGWWVVLGSVASPDNNFTPQTEAAVRRIEVAARRCGLKPFQDFSSKFSNFTRGYTVVVAGAYGSKASADQVLANAKECLAGAYVKQGSYAGE
jgi:hypothetical protein